MSDTPDDAAEAEAAGPVDFGTIEPEPINPVDPNFVTPAEGEEAADDE